MISVPHDRIMLVYLDPAIDKDSALTTAYLISLEDKCTGASLLGRKRKKGYPFELRFQEILYDDMVKIAKSPGKEMAGYEVLWPDTDWDIAISLKEDKQLFNRTANLLDYIGNKGRYDEFKIGKVSEIGAGKRLMVLKCTGTEDVLTNIEKIYGNLLISCEIRDENLVDAPYKPPFDKDEIHVEEVPKPEHAITHKFPRKAGINFGELSYITFTGGDESLLPLNTEIVRGEKRTYFSDLDIGGLAAYVSTFRKTTKGIKNIRLHFKKPGIRKVYDLDGKSPAKLCDITKDLIKRYVKTGKTQERLKKEKKLRKRKRRKARR